MLMIVEQGMKWYENLLVTCCRLKKQDEKKGGDIRG